LAQAGKPSAGRFTYRWLVTLSVRSGGGVRAGLVATVSAETEAAMSPTKTAPRRTQRERSEATTSQLVATARKLFARDGYAATSLETVARRCGVTKGAFYHHFNDKAELFAAVYEEEERKLCDALTEAYFKKKDPWSGFAFSSKAFLEASLDPGVQRITLIDAPSALGFARMREIQSRYTLALMKEGIRQAIAAGQIRHREVDPLANVLFGGMCQAVTYVLESPDQQAALKKINRELNAVVEGLAL
jgi:AcrR family transcriptional regulator